jgi:predicted nucleic acid-binding protein
MDLADASLVAIGERLDLYDVVTLDRRDFAIYRARSGRAFINRFDETT